MSSEVVSELAEGHLHKTDRTLSAGVKQENALNTNHNVQRLSDTRAKPTAFRESLAGRISVAGSARVTITLLLV